MPAAGHRHPAEVLAGGAVLVHVALREHGHPGGRGEQPEGGAPAEVHVHGRGGGSTALDTGPEAELGALVEGPVHQHVVRRAAVHGHRRLMNRAAGRSPAVVDAAPVGELPDAQAARDVDLVVLLRRVEHDAVDLLGAEPGVPDGGVAALDGEAQRAAPRVLRELGGADPRDGGPTREGHRHRSNLPPGSSITTLPVT